jgi:hypothetical protein
MAIHEFIEKLRQEREVIRQAPMSFLFVCIVVIGGTWEAFHVIYGTRLETANDDATHWQETANRWQSDVGFWKDVAGRPLPISTPSAAAPASPVQTSAHPIELTTPLHSPKPAPQPKGASPTPSDPPPSGDSNIPSTPQVINAPSCPQGICPTGPTFGNQTVINTPPPSSIEGYEVLASNPEKDNEGHPITKFRFYVSEPVADQKFIAVCDRPCTALAADTSPPRGVIMSGDFLTGNITNQPTLAAWVVNYAIHPGQFQVFTVVSKDTDPVAITRFAFGKFPIAPQ